MKDYGKELEDMQNRIAAMQKELTMQKGVGVESQQDGNRGNADSVSGNVDFEKMEQIAKKKMLISKMMSEE